MKGPISTILSWLALISVLVAFGLAIYGLLLLGPFALTAIGAGFGVTVAVVALVAKNEREHRNAEHAALPARLAYLRQPAPVVAGPVITRPRVDIFTWVVRKQQDGRFAVLPMTKSGIALWEHTLAIGLPWDDAWNLRNREQRAIGK
jgi:hypothetical protein